MGYADGIRVFSTSSTGGLSILRWFQGSWRVNVTGLTVAPKSSLTTFGVKNSTGTTNGIYVLATGITGSLLEIVWDRNRDYQNFFVGECEWPLLWRSCRVLLFQPSTFIGQYS